MPSSKYLFLLVAVLLATLAAADSQLRQCKQQCRMQRGSGYSQKQCLSRCEQTFGFDGTEEADEEENPGRRGEEEFDPQCWSQCARQSGSKGEMLECVMSKCRRQFQDEIDSRRRSSEEQQYRQCRQMCQSRTESPMEERSCEQRCMQHSRGGRYGVDSRRSEERQAFQECQSKCQSHHTGSPSEQRRCLSSCMEQQQQQQRRRRGSSSYDDEEMEVEEEWNRRSGSEEYRQCRERCQSQTGSGSERRQCEFQCQKQSQRRRGGGRNAWMLDVLGVV